MFIISFVQDTVAQGVDSLKAVTDSLAASVGSTVGGFVAAKLSLAFGVAVKFLTEITKPVLAKFASLSPWQKATVAVLYGQLVAFGNVFFAAHGLPSVSTDPNVLPTAVLGLAVALVAMGVNALKDAIFAKKVA